MGGLGRRLREARGGGEVGEVKKHAGGDKDNTFGCRRVSHIALPMGTSEARRGRPQASGWTRQQEAAAQAALPHRKGAGEPRGHPR